MIYLEVINFAKDLSSIAFMSLLVISLLLYIFIKFMFNKYLTVNSELKKIRLSINFYCYDNFNWSHY